MPQAQFSLSSFVWLCPHLARRRSVFSFLYVTAFTDSDYRIIVHGVLFVVVVAVAVEAKAVAHGKKKINPETPSCLVDRDKDVNILFGRLG